MKGFSRLVVVALAWGALTAGARYPWAYWPLAAACAALGVWAIASSASWRRSEWRTMALALAVVAAAMLAQLVPLPYGLVAVISPAAHAFLTVHQVGFAVAPPAWHALSIEPAATWDALALYTAFAVFLLGLVDAFGRVTLERFVVRLMTFGVAMAIFGVVQRAASGTEPFIYGVWRAPELSTPFGPFFNRNHFAGWMIMALPVALGYATAVLHASPPPATTAPGAWARWTATPEASRFLLAAFAVLMMGAALVLTGSRSGIVAFALAMVVFGVVVVQRTSGRLARRAVAAGLAVLFVGAIAWAGTHATLERFSLASSDLPGRVAAWRDTWRIAGEFPLTGSGLGTYERAMLVYQSGDRLAMFAQAHNEYLQLLAEGGALVTGAVIVACLILAGVARRRLRDAPEEAGRARSRGGTAPELVARWVRVGAAAGLVGIAAQSVVEYSLQRPGNAALCVVLIGLVLHRTRDGRTGPTAG